MDARSQSEVTQRDAKASRSSEVSVSLCLYISCIIALVDAVHKKPFIPFALFICCYVADTLKTLSILMGILRQYVLFYREMRHRDIFKQLLEIHESVLLPYQIYRGFHESMSQHVQRI